MAVATELMTSFKNSGDLEQYLKRINPDYGQYATGLFSKGVTSSSQLGNASLAVWVECGVTSVQHVEDIRARSKGKDSQAFNSYQEFEAFLRLEGSSRVHKFADRMWAAGHRSCASIAHAYEELIAQYGTDIQHLLAFCSLRSVMCTRSQLLNSTLPAPVMSTSPSSLQQPEKARPKHPKSVQAFDVAPVVQEYLDNLPDTLRRFKFSDDANLTLAAREAASERIWDIGVLEPANSLISFQSYSQEAHDQAGSSARWQAQGNTTETHSELAAQHCCPTQDDADSTALPQSDLGSSSARVAQELVDQSTRVRHSWTFDYFLKTSPSPNDRCLSIVELKRVERLSLRGTAQPIDWEHPPNIPDIWSRQCDGVSALLQDNVDSVIAQVSGYTAAHGIKYGMISNILWSWAFVMDGKNHMQISQPFRYDATSPTVLQIHSWVTDMALTSEALPTWTPLEEHPGAATSVTLPKPPSTRSPAMSKLGVTPAISKPDHSKPGGGSAAGSSTQQKHSTSVALSANSSLFVPGMASPLRDCMCPEAAAQQAASLFSVESVQAVLAVGTSGPVFNARLSSGEAMALKVASLGSSKHHDLKHQKQCLMALRSLWGHCVPHVLLAGELRAHGHGYGLGTMLVHGRHPNPGDTALLPLAEDALRMVHGCNILVNDLHSDNIVLTTVDNKPRVYFIDFSHSILSPSLAQCAQEIRSLHAVFLQTPQ